jgi:hypothetical protein
VREIFPRLRQDPSVDEVVTAVLHYAQSKYLCDKKYLRCNEALRLLFGTDSFPIATLHQRLIDEHLYPVKHIQVEYTLSSVGSLSMSSSEDRFFNASSIAKIGGKVFDIEVDVQSESSLDAQTIVNDVAQLFDDCDCRLSALHTMSQYFARKISILYRELQNLRAIEACPLLVKDSTLDSMMKTEIIERNDLNWSCKPSSSTSKHIEAMYAFSDIGALLRGRSSYHFMSSSAPSHTEDDQNDDNYSDEDDADDSDSEDGESDAVGGNDFVFNPEKENVGRLSESKGSTDGKNIVSGNRDSTVDVQSICAGALVGRRKFSFPSSYQGAIHNLTNFIDVGEVSSFDSNLNRESQSALRLDKRQKV